MKNDLEKIIEMKEEQCYYVDNDSHDLTVWKSAENDESNVLKSDKTNQILIDLFDMSDMTNNISKTIFQQNLKVLSDTINENVSISFRIQAHQNANLKLIDQVVVKYSAVWSETEWVVDIFEKYWMKICLKNNWKVIDAKLKHKFYSVLVNECAVIDETLDKLHDQEKAYWIQNSTLYACLIFVVWWTVYKNETLIWKEQAVVDLRELNQVTVSDVYLLSLQSDIIMSNISVMNSIDFFY